jgi:hypothetical protein
MIHLIELLYVGLHCIVRCYKLLNPGITIEIIEIIQDTLRIVLFFQLNMWAWLHNASLPGHPKALLAPGHLSVIVQHIRRELASPAPENRDMKP